jgi:hypothetical protein
MVGIFIRKKDNPRLLTRDRFSASGVCDRDEGIKQYTVLLVVPVAKDDSELAVVLMRFGLGVNDKGSAEAIDVLTIIVGMYPVCTPLTGCIDRDLIRERLAGWNAAADKAMEVKSGLLGDKKTGAFLPLSHTCGPIVPRS